MGTWPPRPSRTSRRSKPGYGRDLDRRGQVSIMQWCLSCGWGSASGGMGRREFLLSVGQACVAVGLAPRLARSQTIMDETTDVKIGREADPEMLKRFGYYDSPHIQNYVAQVGQRVVSRAD